jgi:spore maturation protein CgeB
LFFRNERDILAELNWAKYHPEELERIRQNGYLLVKERHTFDERAKVVLDNVMKVHNQDAERLLWKEWRATECPKTPHKKFNLWVNERKK